MSDTQLERYRAFVRGVMDRGDNGVCPVCSYLWLECECGVVEDAQKGRQRMSEELRAYLLYELDRILAEIRTPMNTGLIAGSLTEHLRAVVARWDENTVVPGWFLEMQR